MKRKNGFSWPPDKAQVFSIVILVYFGLIFFGTFTAALDSPWSYLIGCIYALLYFGLLALMITVMLINPGEHASIDVKVVPTSFDREKHKHVIENQFCNICQMIV